MGIKEAGRVDGVFLAHMLVIAVLALVLYFAYVVELDAMLINAKSKVEFKRNETSREQVEAALKELKELKEKK